MIDLSADNIKKTATNTGFIKDNVEKVMRLIDILEKIFSTRWKEKFSLKGGTAINMFYVGMPRLSIDIDLDYIGADRNEMLSDKKEFADYIENFLFQNNYSLSNASKSFFALDSFVFQYINNAGNRDTIKIEVNYLNRVHILSAKEKIIDVLGYKGDVSISVLNEYELYGSKLAALIGRTKPRDVYDSYKMIGSQLIKDIDLLRKCFVFYNCVGGHADMLEFDMCKFDTLSKKDFDRLLKPLLSKNEKFNEQLAISEVKKYLCNVLRLTANERAFIEDFREKRYNPQKLFGDVAEESCDNIVPVFYLREHPMAIWKCKTMEIWEEGNLKSEEKSGRKEFGKENDKDNSR